MSQQLDLPERRRLALRETWAYAKRHSGYYATILSDVPPEGEELPALRSLPTCTAAVLRDNIESLRCLRGIPCFTLFSGGTTGQPRMIFGSRYQMERTLLVEEELTRSSSLRPLVLATDGGHHGTLPSVPGDLGFLQVPLRNRKNYAWAWQLLTSEHRFEGYDSRIRHLIVPLPAAKKLMSWVLENRLDTSTLELETLTTYAWYLSRGWRERLGTTLGARVYDCYGFTEIPTALAHECEICDWYHFSHRVFWEAVDLWDGQPIVEGIGRVLVTSLYPWTQDHILFRYDPGDLVQLGPVCPYRGERGIRPLGRTHQAVIIEDQGVKRVALCPGNVQEVVDCLPDIARMEEVRFSGVSKSKDDGFARWRLAFDDSRDPPEVRIDFEMKWSPTLFSDAWARFSSMVEERLLQRNRTLHDLVERGAVRLRVEGLCEGELADEEVTIC